MAFEENKHPRAKDGKFTSKGNEGAGSGSKKATTPKPKGIDYENIEYPKGTSKEYTMSVNKRFNDALPILQKLGIKLEDFGGRPSKQGGYEDNTDEIMDKYVFNPFHEKYGDNNNDAWNKEYQPIYDAIEAVTDKNYNDWWINEHSKKETPKQTEQIEIDGDYERAVGPAPDPEEFPEDYKKYISDYKKWLKNGESWDGLDGLKEDDEEKERKQAYKLFNLPF